MGLITALAVVALVVIIAVMLYPEIARRLVEGVRREREVEARAMRMLSDILTAEELSQLRERGYLAVPSRQRPQRVYHIPRRTGLVSVYDGGVLTERLCVGSTIKIPDGDVVLLHKLMIEGNEEEYLRLANHFSPRPYSYPL